MLLDRESALWAYLSPELKGLIADGETLLDNIYPEQERVEVTDFSFLVFPFAKAYEGFLKKLFFDLGVISHGDYYGDQIRIGRILNPHYTSSKGNVFPKLCTKTDTPGDTGLPHELWEIWHRGRNRVFHYFPRNFRKLTYEEAVGIARDFVRTMEKAVEGCPIPPESERPAKHLKKGSRKKDRRRHKKDKSRNKKKFWRRRG